MAKLEADVTQYSVNEVTAHRRPALWRRIVHDGQCVVKRRARGLRRRAAGSIHGIGAAGVAHTASPAARRLSMAAAHVVLAAAGAQVVH